jgi:hypothetical protein
LIVELLSVAAVFTGGCLFVRAAGLTGWPVPAFGLLAGICVQVAVGTVQVVTGLPTWPALTLALTAGLPALWWLVRWRRGQVSGLPVPSTVLSLVLLAGAVALLRATNMVKWHIDSYTYLMTSSMLANGSYHDGITPVQATKRLLGVSLLHAPAQLAGEFYLRSITPLLAVATVAALVALFRWGTRDRLPPAHVAGFAVLAVLLLVSSNRFVFSAFYLNGHLLVGALILVLAGCGWLLLTGRYAAAPLMALQLVAIPALVVTRPEGTILAGLALLPTLLSRAVPLRHRAAALAVLGVTTAGWQASLLWIYRQHEEPVPLSVTGMLAAGVLLAAAAGLLPRLPQSIRLLWITEAGLWLALGAFALRDPPILVDSVRATVENVVLDGGAGRWGATLVVLAGLVVIAIGFAWRGRETSLRFAVTTFLPVALLLAYLRDEGAYRVGQYDSLNRMFMQVVPVAVLFVVAAFATVSTRELDRGDDDDARDTGRGDRQPHPEVHRPEPGDPVADHAVGGPA